MQRYNPAVRKENDFSRFVAERGTRFLQRIRTDCKPRANNRYLKRKIEYPVLRYGWIDHGGLDNIVVRIRKIISDFGVYQEIGAT